jgi:hypothetical protein
MKRKYFACLIAFIASMHILINLQYSSANTYISTTYSYNDAQHKDSSTGAPSVDSKASFNVGGWSVYRVYYGQGSYGTGFTNSAALIEIDLSQIPRSDTIESAILHINVIHVIQKYNYDSKLAILSHLRSTGYTGDAESDYWHIDGPSPAVDTLHYFYSGSSSGWKEIDVTHQVIDNLNAGINWAVFWLTPAPWEDPVQIVGEAKGVSVASADYTAGSLAPYLEIHTTSLISLVDAILALQVLAGMNPASIVSNYSSCGADVNGDGNIGLEEVVYILQKVSGYR